MREFGSLKKLKEASLEEIEKIVPKKVALTLYNFLKNK